MSKYKVSFIAKNVLDWASEYSGDQFHALLCDPPYELGFMGKDWDRTGIAFDPKTWEAFKPHLHPGAFGMAFASSRGWHRMAVAIEDAGFVIHPTIFMWTFGSGFPKATRIDTQVDRMAGIEIAHGIPVSKNIAMSGANYSRDNKHKPTTPSAKAWAGHRYGLQALKPAVEPIIVFQKPYEGKPVKNITRTGAGSLNIEGGRIGSDERFVAPAGNTGREAVPIMKSNDVYEGQTVHGRWPSNFLLGDKEAAERLDRQSGAEVSRFFFQVQDQIDEAEPVFYCPKAGTRERWVNLTCDCETPNIEAWVNVDQNQQEQINATSHEKDISEETSEDNLGSNIVSSGSKLTGQSLLDIKSTISTTTNSTTGSPISNSQTPLHTKENIVDVSCEMGSGGSPAISAEKESQLQKNTGTSPMKDTRLMGVVAPATSVELYKTSVCEKCGSKIKSSGHPTQKPLSLTKYLATLLLPPKEYGPRRILVPFAGVGSEAIGCKQAGWEDVVGIEMSTEYVEIAEKRFKFLFDQKHP